MCICVLTGGSTCINSYVIDKEFINSLSINIYTLQTTVYHIAPFIYFANFVNFMSLIVFSYVVDSL